MTLLLLHGPAINNSRKKLQELRNKFHSDNVLVFENGEDTGILTNLQSLSLFEGERLVIVENPPDDFRLPITSYQLPTTLLLWFDHEVTEKKPIMEWVKNNKGQVFYFPESREVSVFPFLDYLASGDKKAFLEIEKLKNAGFDIHYCLTMVFYLLRNLVATPTNAPDFIRKKLERQRAGFSLQRIAGLYNATRYKTRSDVIASYYKDVLEIDFKIKSGFLEKSQAEFLLVNKFVD